MIVTVGSTSPTRGSTASARTPQPASKQQGRHISGQHRQGSTGSECSCLNWKEAYRSQNAQCGQGQELYTFANDAQVSLDLVLPFVQSEYCGEFFERFDHNRCVNLQQRVAEGEQQHKTWCYVSPQCQHLGEGARIPHVGASWKTCHAYQDSLLRELSVPELSALAVANNLDLGVLVGFAYRVQPQRWPDVEQFWWTEANTEQPVSVRKVKADGRPVIFEVLADGTGDKVVAVGDALWAISLDDAKYPRTRFGHQCLAGCEQDAIEASLMRAASLDQEAVNVVSAHRAESEAAEGAACQCQSWKELYSSASVSCGQGLEFLPVLSTSDVTGEQALPFAQYDICTDFYQQLDHNNCVKLAMELSPEVQSDQWCYVSSRCGRLNGGKPVEGSSLSWKVCSDSDRATKGEQQVPAFQNGHDGGTRAAMLPATQAAAIPQERKRERKRSSWAVSPWMDGSPVASQPQEVGFTSPHPEGRQLEAMAEDYLESLSLNMQSNPTHQPSLRGVAVSNLTMTEHDGISKRSSPMHAVGPGLAATRAASTMTGLAATRAASTMDLMTTEMLDTPSETSSRRWCRGWCNHSSVNRLVMPIVILIMLLSAAWCLSSFATCLPWPRSSQRLLTRVCVIAQKPCRWLDGFTNARDTTRLPAGALKRLRSHVTDGPRTVWFSPSITRGLSARRSSSPRFHIPAKVSPRMPSSCHSPTFCMSPREVAPSACSQSPAIEVSPPNSLSPSPSSIWSPCYTCRSTVCRPAPRPPPSPPPFPSELPLPTPSISPGVMPLLLPVLRRSLDSPPVLPSGLLHRMPDIHIAVSTSPRSSFPSREGACTPSSGRKQPGYASPSSRCSMSNELSISPLARPHPPKHAGTTSSPAGQGSHLVVATPPCQQTGHSQRAHAGPAHARYTA